MWNKLFEVKSRAMTINGIYRALARQSDLVDNCDVDEVKSSIANGFITFDGHKITVWADGWC